MKLYHLSLASYTTICFVTNYPSLAIKQHSRRKHIRHLDNFYNDEPIFRSADEYKHSREFRKNGVKCGTAEPTTEEVESSNRIAEQWRLEHRCDGNERGKNNPLCKDSHSQGLRLLDQVTPVIIQVKWHAIRRSDGVAFITKHQIQDTIDVLNKAFMPNFQFQFNMKNDLNVVDNSLWYNIPQNHAKERVIKTNLRQGDCTTLNIYSGATLGGLLGWATLPHDCQDKMWNDGVVINEKTLKGGIYPDLNLGHTLTHEVGHWMGLWHTFHNGCHGGDEIDDTPAQASPSYGCEVGRDSCPNQPGTDPIHNFMGYSDDACMTDDFTESQVVRMLSQWEKYRDTPPPPTLAPLPCETGMVEFHLELATDMYGEETSWKLEDMCGMHPMIVHHGGDYGQLIHEHIRECVPESFYKFSIFDEYEDGICCDGGNGYYKVRYDGKPFVTNGGIFEKEEITEFGSCPIIPVLEGFIFSSPTTTPSYGPSVDFTNFPSDVPSAHTTTLPSDSPSIHSTSFPSNTPTHSTTFGWNVLYHEDFNEGWGAFMPGDQDNAIGAKTLKKTGRYFSGRFNGSIKWRKGEASVFIKSRKGLRSAIKTDFFNITGYKRVEISFDFRVIGTRNDKRSSFRLQYCCDECHHNTQWENVEKYTSGKDFKDNEDWRHEVQEINTEGRTRIKFRFRNYPIISSAITFIDEVMIKILIAQDEKLQTIPINNSLESFGIYPTSTPTAQPSARPTSTPSVRSSVHPTKSPTIPPSAEPTNSPSNLPSVHITDLPSNNPTHSPTLERYILYHESFDEGWGMFMPGDQDDASQAKTVTSTRGNGSGRFNGYDKFRKGKASVFIKGRKGLESAIKTTFFDISGYKKVTISFDCKIAGTKDNRRNLFYLQYCYDECRDNQWESAKVYTIGKDFMDLEDWRREVNDIDIKEGHTRMRFRFRNFPIMSSATVFFDEVGIKFQT